MFRKKKAMSCYPVLRTNHLAQRILTDTEFSTVYCFSNSITKETFVLKHGKTSKSRKFLLNEYKILRYISFQGNSCIIIPHGLVEHNDFVALKLPFINAPTLHTYINKAEFLSESEIKIIFLHIIRVVNFLHNLNIVHRDLKLENILYDSATQKITLIDFGLAMRNKKRKRNKIRGSLHYLAPELIEKQEDICLKKVDIWALGVILYRMTYLSRPFTSKTNTTACVFAKIVKTPLFHKQTTRVSKLGQEVSSDLKNLLELILEKDPKKRISYSEIIKHPWFKKI